MRLICPNCGAQYEVSDDVIPEAGRDVQCSNCGQTWFQNHTLVDPALEDTDDIAIVEPEDWGEPNADEFDESDLDYAGQDTGFGDPVEDVWAQDETFASDETQSAPEFEAPTTPTIPPHRELDPDVASILREEADIEAQARAAEHAGLETQGDLGLIEADPAITKREAEIRQRMAEIQGVPNTDPDGPRRELLPDIEEINSSLSDRTPDAAGTDYDSEEYQIQHRRGFRYGFFLVASIVIFTIALYAYGPQIVEQIPQAGGMISDFTAYIDKSRIWLDDVVQRLIVKVSAI